MPDTASTSNELLSYRMSEVEKGLKELRTDLSTAVGTLGGQATALQTQLSNYQINLSDRYVLRKDHDELERRIEEVADANGARGWMIAGSLLGALVSTIIGAVGWLRPLH